MITVKELLGHKGSHVVSIGKYATVVEAALLMNQRHVGAVVVMDGDHVEGMFSERDVLVRVVGERRDPATTRVEEVMTAEVVCCTPETTLEEARGSMKNRRIRHLPVVDGGRRLVGLISIGDLNAHQVTAQEQTIHLLHEYLYGRV
ncbi:MAG TPA: CBS domain-containing protein [Gemmataceae bacterium]|jgi:CBS domain-containing protein|nr:CBS domain-containing protein [Gemmataceae bacterium]